MAASVAFGPRSLTAQSFSVSGSPATMSVATAIAGVGPSVVTSTVTTYSVTNVFVVAKIRARLDAPLPPGVTLRINVQAPPGGTSAGWVTLSTANQQVITNVPLGSFSNLQIRYELSATTGAGVIALNTRVVSLTLNPF